MTFAKAVLKRKPFSCRIMGIPLSFEYDDGWVGIAGMANRNDGRIMLDPSSTDHVLLDTAAHEVIEVWDARTQWEMTHQHIQQLGVLVGSMLECEV